MSGTGGTKSVTDAYGDWATRCDRCSRRMPATLTFLYGVTECILCIAEDRKRYRKAIGEVLPLLYEEQYGYPRVDRIVKVDDILRDAILGEQQP